jgi:hypothetical protein
MTSCSECLQAFSTMPLAEVRPGSIVGDHCASCASCSSVIQETVYAERRLSSALAESRSAYTSEQLADRVLAESERIRRKEVGRWVRGLLAAAGCITFWFFMQNVFVPWTGGERSTATETLTMHCLFTDEASSLVTPYLRSGRSGVYRSGLHTITIRGRSDEVARAKLEVLGVDSRQQCDLPIQDAESQRAKFEADSKAAGAPASNALSQRAKFEADRKAAAAARAATSGDIPKKD